MKLHTLQFLVLLWLVIITGCSESSDDGNPSPGVTPDSGGTGDPTAADDAGADLFNEKCEVSTAETDKDGNPLIHLLDANNYSFQGKITISTIPVKSSTNLVFDWSEVTQDLRGRDLDPLLDVDQLRVVLFQDATEDELMQLISSEGYILRYVYGAVYMDTENAIASTNLLDLHPPAGELPDDMLLSYVDIAAFPPEQYSYAAILGEGSVLPSGFLLITFFRPDPNATNTEVKFTNDLTKLDFTVDLTSLQEITLPLGVSNITMKWTDADLITKTASGNKFIPNAITEVMIGHYPNMTPQDLEDRFLNVDGIAETIWSKFLSEGTSISLADLQNEQGEPFPGINEQGTWLFVLRCGGCTSPVPWFLTVLQAC